jgi:hypothetical protein
MVKCTLFIIFFLMLLAGCSSESRKADWITDALQSIREGRYPRIKAISYWHEGWENSAFSTSDLRLDSSPEALQAYQEGIADDYFLTDIEVSDSLKILPPASGAYHCAFPDFGNTEDSVSAQLITDFEDLVGKKLAWVTFADNWVTGIHFPQDEVQIIYDHGSIPYIKLMAFSEYEYSEGGVDSIYTMASILDGKFDDDLGRWAKDAAATGIPMMVCFGVEVNGEWFSWNGLWNGGAVTDRYGDMSYPDGPERFRDAYRRIVGIFRDNQAYNVNWVFHVNAGSYPDEDWNSMAYYYPGDDYVDWIGISVYGPQTPKEARQYWETFTEIMDTYYPELAALSSSKPLAVVEFGVVE